MSLSLKHFSHKCICLLQVYQTRSSFPLNDEQIHNFYHAPLCSVPEATSSPRKRRLSLQGTVGQVYDLKEGPNWKRRDVVVEDMPTATKIRVKLWNEHSSLIQEEDSGTDVFIENLEVDIYQEKRHPKTTDSTTLQVSRLICKLTYAVVPLTKRLITQISVSMIRETYAFMMACVCVCMCVCL
ncbi:hypothetical protein HOLleu_11138 [Holothuria leucospilota]|uniref:Uncharacterized protein n=1 Tax=Holothuria leucospilota TaxID=206669 RepID=A0A9Q1CFV1_HOLLE|nr:hypothetical protein HOLleu_11138 [Holothuria leucospilota]